MLSRIRELGHISVLERNLSNIFWLPEELTNNLADSKRIMSFVSVFHPASPFLYSEYMETDIETTAIITKQVLDNLQTEFNSELSLFKNE